MGMAVIATTALAAPIGATGQTAFANQMLAAVNQYRVQQALTEWPLDETLVAITLDHSRLIAQHARLGDDGFDGRFQRVRSQLCVETLATGFSRAQALVVAWRQLTHPPCQLAGAQGPSGQRRQRGQLRHAARLRLTARTCRAAGPPTVSADQASNAWANSRALKVCRSSSFSPTPMK